MTFTQTQPEFFSDVDAFDEPTRDDAGAPESRA